MRLSSLRSLLHDTQKQLSLNGLEDARLEAELVWMAALHVDKATLYAKFREVPNLAARHIAKNLLTRRLQREPLAFLTGQREFFGLKFCVAPGILIPRPETETLVTEAIRLGAEKSVVVADVGTGSGIIAVSLAVNLPRATIFATDISKKALELADLNVTEHQVNDRVHLLYGDLLSPLPCQVDLLLANLPYVMSTEISGLEPEIRLHEPIEALDGGEDGLNLVSELLITAPPYMKPGGSILLELDPRQMDRASELATTCFSPAIIRTILDLAGQPRVLIVTLE